MKTVSIHQPEHFPYIGFFEKMRQSDVFVILDNVQFKKNNFQNRNKFLNKKGEEEWFSVQIEKGSSKRLINEINVAKDTAWKTKLLKKIKYNFNKDLEEIYSYEKLVDINMASIYAVREKLGIKTELILASELNLAGSKTDLLINICNELNINRYISGQGGKAYLDLDSFKAQGIEVIFPDFKIDNYYSSVQYL